ncbi:MAG: HEAT repeat domain-containing protein [Thermodesulfovibrionia bacterium]
MMHDETLQQPLTEDAGVVTDLIKEIQKAKKLLRMYPPNNPVYISSLDSLYKRFTEFLQGHGELRLRIMQKSILYGNEHVYHNPEREDNLALFFFKDGVRELTFTDGLQKGEVEEFMKILTFDTESEQVSDDVVTLLWERDFEHIMYVVDELYLTDEDVIAEERVYEEIKDKHTKDDEALRKAYNDALHMEATEKGGFTAMSEIDIKNIYSEIRRQELYKTMKFITILFELLYMQTNKNEIKNIINYLKSTIDYCILNGDFMNASYLVEKVKETLNKSPSPYMSGNELRVVYDYINNPLIIEEIGRRLDTSVTIDDRAFLEYVNHIGQSAIPHFIQLLRDVQSLRGKQLLLDALTILGKKDMKSLADGLKDPSWEVVKDVLYILGRIGTSIALEYLTHTLSHPDERVRREAIRVIGNLNNPNAFPYIKDALNDKSPSVRITAVRTLSNMKTEGAKKILLSELSKKEFSSKELNEKREFYRAIAQWNDIDVREFLMSVLKKRPFWKRKRHNETRACAALALGIMKVKDAIPLLKNAQKEGDDLLKEHATSALERMSS